MKLLTRIRRAVKAAPEQEPPRVCPPKWVTDDELALLRKSALL